jgi:hypothetical protein
MVTLCLTDYLAPYPDAKMLHRNAAAMMSRPAKVAHHETVAAQSWRGRKRALNL